MAKAKLPDNTAPNSKQEVGWTTFIDFFYINKGKLAWVIGILGTVFFAGFKTGVFYQSIINKFELSELKTKHSEEIQKIRNEQLVKDIKRIEETKGAFIDATINTSNPNQIEEGKK